MHIKHRLRRCFFRFLHPFVKGCTPLWEVYYQSLKGIGIVKVPIWATSVVKKSNYRYNINEIEYVYFLREAILIGDLEKVAEFYKALGDETRLTIVDMLSTREMCVCEIIDRLGMSQPAISHHLKVLKQAGIVKDSRDGKWIYYSLNENVFERVFAGTEKQIIQTYSEPIRQKLSQLQPSQIRTNPALCETLMCKKK